MPEQVLASKHMIELAQRNALKATGVSKIEYFSPDALSVKTSCGKMIVKGVNLYVDSLNAETGELLVHGKVSEIIYTENDDEKNWLKRLFK